MSQYKSRKQSEPVITDEYSLQQVASIINRADETGVIICGPRSSTKREFARSVAQLSTHLNYPVLADPISNARFGNAGAIAAYETFLIKAKHLPQKPEIVIRFGNVPTSKWLNDYMTDIHAQHIVHVQPDGVWADDSHRVSTFIQADESWFCHKLIEATHQKSCETNWNTIEDATWHTIHGEIEQGEYFDGAAVYDVVDLIPDESTLFVGNSLPVRHLDQFGRPTYKMIYAYANRGASGIDGNVSTALGVGAARPDKPLVAILGDITFYHDMNGLLAIQRLGVPVTIVLLNNNGGGIFHRLPIRDFEPAFTEFFLTPHGLEFEHAARLYGLEYVCAHDRESFRKAFAESVNNRSACIIEVRTDAKEDLRRRQEIIDAVHRRLTQLEL